MFTDSAPASGLLGSVHRLKVRDLAYQVHLGCQPEERAQPQKVLLSVEFRFHQAPLALSTDELEQTICYAELNTAIQKHFAKREYKLIEKMAADAYMISRELSRGQALVSVEIHKVHPPVPNIEGGTVFVCGDF